MNKYAEEMQKVALNRLEREAVKGAWSRAKLDDLAARGGLRSQESRAKGSMYGIRQMLTKKVEGPDAAFRAGEWALPPKNNAEYSVDTYVPGKNSHGKQYDADSFRAAWSSPASKTAVDEALDGMTGRRVRRGLGTGRSVPLDKPVLHVVADGNTDAAHVSPSLSSHAGGAHVALTAHVPVKHITPPALGYTLDGHVAAHEIYEVDAIDHRVLRGMKREASPEDHWRALHQGVAESTTAGGRHAGTEVLLRERARQQKDPYAHLGTPASSVSGSRIHSLGLKRAREVTGESAMLDSQLALHGSRLRRLPTEDMVRASEAAYASMRRSNWTSLWRSRDSWKEDRIGKALKSAGNP